jgi:hypothetical protein
MFDRAPKEEKPMKRDRFIVTYEQKIEKTFSLGSLQILVDTETGVNYINTVGESYSGLTPLLDENGNVVRTLDIGKD